MPDSVSSYINAQPEVAMDYNEFWKQNNIYGTHSPDNQMMVRFLNLFTGEDKRVKDAYQAYLDNLNNRNEYLATQSARAYDKMMDDTKVQRALKDYEAAGLNPFLLLDGGNFSANTVTSSKSSYKANSMRKEEKQSDAGRNIALLLLAVARIAAAFM